jgi:membrane-associated phospholipid phosphatase
MLVGLLLTQGFAAGLSLLARRWVDRGGQEWDDALMERIVRLPLFDFEEAVWWEAYGASSVLIPVAILAWGVAARAGRPVLAATLGLGYLLAKPIIFTGWAMWDRPRPELVADGVASPPLHSFPSGHSMQAVAMYGLLTLLWVRASRSPVERSLAVLLCAALVAVVSLARLRMGVHWPSDIVGGSLIGLAWLLTLGVALRRAEAAGGR